MRLLDASMTALRISRRFLSKEGRLVVGEIPAVTFRDGAFSAVWSSGVLEHWLPDEQRDVLRAAAGITRPEGLFVAVQPLCRLHTGQAILEAIHL